MYDNRPLHDLNELEVINGELWANIYLKNFIVVIDLKTFEVKR